MNPMDLRKGIKLATDQVVNVLSEISKPISTKEEVAQVGTISANRYVCFMIVWYIWPHLTWRLYRSAILAKL